MYDADFAANTEKVHSGENEYHKRVLFLMEQSGSRPITGQEKIIFVQHFAHFQQFSRPGVKANTFAGKRHGDQRGWKPGWSLHADNDPDWPRDTEARCHAASSSCRLKSAATWGRKRKAEERLRIKRRIVPTDMPITKTSISSVPKSSKLKKTSRRT